MVERKEGWEKRFSQYLTDKRDIPFEWGENDCILFSAKAFLEITGSDEFSQYLGYKGQDGATAIVEKHGSIDALITKHLGQGHRNYLMAKRGDIVLMKIPDFTLGIVDDTGQWIVSISPKGWVKLPLKKAVKIWSY